MDKRELVNRLISIDETLREGELILDDNYYDWGAVEQSRRQLRELMFEVQK